MGDAFDLGYRVGLVCNSDGHKGAPGACYPGASEFGAYSGLTCFLANDLSREAIFGAMRARRHYGTTGCRMHMEVRAHLGAGGAVYTVDPRVAASDPVPSDVAHMGDIARTGADAVELEFRLDTHAPIERVDVLRGMDALQTIRPHDAEGSNRMRVIWEGAEYRGRGRTTTWTGHIAVDDARIVRMGRINAWNLERLSQQVGPRRVEIDAVTTGNFGGVDLWLDGTAGEIEVVTGHAAGRFALPDISGADTVLEAGGLGRRIRLYRLPQKMDVCHLSDRVRVPLLGGRDTPLWVRVVTEHGFVGWSSPIYVVPG